MSKQSTIQLTQVKHTFDVRRQLDQDYALQLAMIVEAGEDLPAIRLTIANELIDGRHRLKAYELAGRSEIPYVVERGVRDDRGALLALAFNANIGGSKPPTSDDIVFAMMQFIEAKVSRVQVLNSLNMPKEVSLKYFKQATHRINRRKLQQGRDMVAEGYTVPKAAEELGIDETELRAEVRGVQKQKGMTNSVAISESNMGRSYRAHSMKMAMFFKRLAEYVETGKISAEDVHALFNHAWKLADQHVRNISEWRDRFDNGTAAIAKPLKRAAVANGSAASYR